MTILFELQLECQWCGDELKGELGDNGTITIEPCEACLYEHVRLHATKQQNTRDPKENKYKIAD